MTKPSSVLAVTVTLLLATAAAAQQKQPYLFDVSLAEKPGEVQSMIDQYSAWLPELPLNRMTEIALDGPISLWLYSEAAHFLDLLVATEKQDYEWPADTASCVAHDAFAMPELLQDGATTECQAAFAAIGQALAGLDACGEAAEPELYVLDYPPGVVNDENTNTVLDLIGIMGSTFTEFPPLYDGILPADFVGRLRDVLRKLRYDELYHPLADELDSLDHAAWLLGEHASCFIDEGRALLAERIAAMRAESAALHDHIGKLARAGEAEHLKERLRLGVISRWRHDLPHPTLTRADREFLALWIGGLYWRLRGGGIILLGGTQECRRLGLRRPFNVIGDLSGAAHGTEAADGVYCEIFSGWGQWFDMGTTPGQEDKYYDLVEMTNRGYEQIRTAVVGSTILNPCTIPDPPFVLSIGGLSQKGYDTVELFAGGLSMGPCYYFPWDQLLGWYWAYDMQPPYIQAIDGPTAIGEVCAGGSIALGLTRTLLRGWAAPVSPFAGDDAVVFVEPGGDEASACANEGVFARVSVMPLDGAGGPLPPGQNVAIVEDPPYVIAGGVEEYTDPETGVTEYTLEVGSNRCAAAPYEIGIRVGGATIQQTAQIRFTCPPVAGGEVVFLATPSQVPADGVSAASIRIDVEDACGNPAFGRTVELTAVGDVLATLSSTAPMTLDDPEGGADGAAFLDAASSQAGQMGLAATIDDATFHSAPDLVTFTAWTPDDDGTPDDDEEDGTGSSGGSSGCSCGTATGHAGARPSLLSLLLGLAS